MGVLRRWSVVLLVLLWLLPGSSARATAAYEDSVGGDSAVPIVADRRDGRPASLTQADDAEDEQPFVSTCAGRVRPSAFGGAVCLAPRASFRARTRAFLVGIPRGPPRSV